jgi:hypothetical protein
MNKKELETRIYVPPFCEVMTVEGECFFCTSITPHVPSSSEEDWDNEEESEDEIDF